MKPSKQSDATFEEISQAIWQHLDERDWNTDKQRGVAISIALEAAELLEHYQWQEEPVGNKQALAEELADIFIYAFQFAQQEDIDIADAIRKKLAKAGEKYPAKQFKGKQGADMRAAWVAAKIKYRKEGL